MKHKASQPGFENPFYRHNSNCKYDLWIPILLLASRARAESSSLLETVCKLCTSLFTFGYHFKKIGRALGMKIFYIYGIIFSIFVAYKLNRNEILHVNLQSEYVIFILLPLFPLYPGLILNLGYYHVLPTGSPISSHPTRLHW